MYRTWIAIIGLALLGPVGLSAEDACKSNEVHKDNLCWYRARQKMTLEKAEQFCSSEGYRLPTMQEARTLLGQYPGKKVQELGQVFGVSGPFFFWVQQNPESDKVQIVLPGTSMTMDLDPTSKLYAQCVRSPD